MSEMPTVGEPLPPEAGSEPTPPQPKVSGRSADGKLDPYRSQLGQVPDDEIARLAGVSRGVVGAYRRKHDIAAYEGYLFAKGHAPVAPKAKKPRATSDGAPAATRKAGRPSRAEQFLHLLGVESDAAVARKAGVSRAAVTGWRLARGIQASQPRSGPRAKGDATSGRRRGSRLDAFRDRMGTVSDLEIADLAGVTREVVGEYRRKNGIPAWEGFRSKPRKTKGRAAAAVAAAPATANPRASRAPSGARLYAYTITASARGTTRDYVALGSDIEDACRVARAALEGRADGPWTLDGVKVLLEALG